VKEKFKAFSYVELLFGMMIVCLIFISAVPFLTRKANTANASTGEFQCYAAFNGTEYRLFERLKRGNGAFSAPVDVTENGCKFFRPKNVNTYSLQIIGGGGGGSRAVTGGDSFASSWISLGKNGQDGQRISVQTSLGGVWDENGVLTIHKCRNAGEDVPQTDPYREEYPYCVGDGGLARDAINGASRAGGIGKREMEYYNLLGVYHDLLFNSKTNVNTIMYAGRGNGSVSADDDLAKVRQALGETHSVYINLNNYLSSGGADVQSLRNATGQLLTVLRSWTMKNTASEGGAGAYSRFVLKDFSDERCVRGNCLAKGGDGATGNEIFNCSSMPAGSDICSNYETPCDANCNAIPSNVLGGGGAGGRAQIVRDGLVRTNGNGGAGGGGAIIIRW